jgi:WD40 repeat protein
MVGHLGRINGLGFSPDGERVASSSADGTLRLWDARTGQQTLSVALSASPSNTFIPCGVLFSPDGRLLVTAEISARVLDGRPPEAPAFPPPVKWMSTKEPEPKPPQPKQPDPEP